MKIRIHEVTSLGMNFSIFQKNTPKLITGLRTGYIGIFRCYTKVSFVFYKPESIFYTRK